MLTQPASIFPLALVLSLVLPVKPGAGAPEGPPLVTGTEEGFISLFNGKDLTGWHHVNGPAATWSVRDGLIVCTGKPICVLRSERQYENFILELEWVHRTAGGNSGCFVWSDALTAMGQPFTRAIECQILDGRETKDYTSNGDVFAIHGAVMTPDRPHPGGWMRCLPSEKRSRPAGEWNHYRITCLDGTVKLAVNGKEVSGGSGVSPRKGYVCLESEGSEVHFRNIRIKELPASSKPLSPEQVATVAEGYVSLYSGLDLSGWKVPPGAESAWKANDWKLVHDGTGSAITCERPTGDGVYVIDWRYTGKVEKGEWPFDVQGALRAAAVPFAGQLEGWNRARVTVRKGQLTVEVNEKTVVRDLAVPALKPGEPLELGRKGFPVELANLYWKA